MTYTVKYQAGTYEGIKNVNAEDEDEDEAIAKVRAWVHKQMSIPMYYETYRIVYKSD